MQSSSQQTKTNQRRRYQRSKASLIVSPQSKKRKSNQRPKVDYDYVAEKLREVSVKSLRITVAGWYGNRR